MRQTGFCGASENKKLNRYPHTHLQISRSATNTDVASYFDYQSALALRKMALVQGCGMPKYLLAPEVAILLSYLPDLRQRTFIELLWNTGARVAEAMPLRPVDFNLAGDQPFVVLRTLKQQQRGRGRPRKDENLHRIVPLLDPGFVRRLHEYFETFRLYRKSATPIWQISSSQTPRNWLAAAVERAKRDNVTFSFEPITTKVFRHSFAMHLLQHHVPPKVLQAYLGHTELKSTEIYTKVFALDVGRQYGVTFSMPVEEAFSCLPQRE